jgi:hypothetical protein
VRYQAAKPWTGKHVAELGEQRRAGEKFDASLYPDREDPTRPPGSGDNAETRTFGSKTTRTRRHGTLSATRNSLTHLIE